MRWVLPADKGFGHVTALSITKGCQHRDLALAFLNAAVSPAVQIAQALDAPYGPANTLTFDILAEYPEVARRYPAGVCRCRRAANYVRRILRRYAAYAEQFPPA